MTKICTDIKQSKKLIELGIDVSTSDCSWILHPVDGHYILSLTEPLEDDIPCWSLTALLEEIPEIINFDDDESDYALEILKESGLYYLSYGNLLEHDKIEIEPQEYFVDACYEMIIKLHKEGLL